MTSTASLPGAHVARWLTIVLVATVALTGCARSGGAGSPRAPTTTSRAPSEPAQGADAVRYACIPGHASFTVADLEGAPAADAHADPALDLLRAVLEEQAGIQESDLPMDGWRRVVDSPEEVVFLAETPGGAAPYVVVHVVPGVAGAISQDGWAVDSYGSCIPRQEVPDEVSVATWWLDPEAPPIGPEMERIPALVLENACASGRTAEGRILPPTIISTGTEVSITITVRSLGDAECPGHPPTTHVIELGQPLGDRTLLDGGQWPPGDPLRVPEH